VTKTDVAVEMNWICALILPRCTQESVVIYGHLLRYCEGAK